MATYDWPMSLHPSSFEWAVQRSTMQFVGPYNGTRQTIDYAADRWLCSITIGARLRRDAGFPEALFSRVAGGLHRLRVPHFTRPQPVGTMRGAVTLTTAILRGADTLSLTTGMPLCTLEAGDFFRMGLQTYQCLTRAVANGAGVIVVPLVLPSRAAIAAGTVAIWDRPMTEFICPSQTSRYSHMPGILEPLIIELEETF